MANVSFQYVTKRFEDFVAVHDLTIEVEDQEFLVFVGPSGCGKTTSLRMLAGLESVTEGHIYIGDRRVNDVSPKDRDIAMVFQSYALYPHMTVFENMAFSLELQGKRRDDIRHRVQRAAQQMGIEALLQRKPRELSGGQRQRVAVCRAIVREPAVFLMDEPLSNLDAKLRVQARTEISKLHQELGSTFIYVTHDQVEAMTMGTRIAILNGGVLQQVDTPETLYQAPVNMFVAGFIGSPAMNFFPGRLVEQDTQWLFQGNGLQVALPTHRASDYAAHRDRPLMLGVRPEDVHDPSYPAPDIVPTPLKATVSVVERMGNEVILHLATAADEPLVARVDRRCTLIADETVKFLVDAASCHLFDAETEQTLVYGDSHSVSRS
ncbi:MAG: ABC transporter ATP-binding protein [Cyanobacteria bacterium P01_H01_bin.58]